MTLLDIKFNQKINILGTNISFLLHFSLLWGTCAVKMHIKTGSVATTDNMASRLQPIAKLASFPVHSHYDCTIARVSHCSDIFSDIGPSPIVANQAQPATSPPHCRQSSSANPRWRQCLESLPTVHQEACKVVWAALVQPLVMQHVVEQRASRISLL